MSDTPAASTTTPVASSPEDSKASASASESGSASAAAAGSAVAASAGESATKDEKKEEKKAEPAPEVKKMQAVLTTAYGESEKVIDFGPFPQPTITKADQVLIKVHSASINPVDYKINHGHFSMILKKSFPFVAGFDLAGEVQAVGAAVKQFAVGDRVYGDVGGQQGTFAEYVVAPQHTIAKIPTGFTYSSAAGVPLAGLTAYQALLTWGKITEKSRVLVLGGSGGCGAYAVQIAKAVGAQVYATASTRNFDFVRGLGADRVIDYSKQNWWEVLKGDKIDTVFDTVGQANSWDHAKQILGKHANVIQIARQEGAFTPGFFAAVLGRKIASWFGEPHYKFFLTDVSHATEQLDALSKWLEAGKIKPVVESVFPFSKDGGVALFKAIEAGKSRGKNILEVIPPETATQPNVDAIAAAAPPLPVQPEVTVSSSSSSSSSTTEAPAAAAPAAAESAPATASS